MQSTEQAAQPRSERLADRVTGRLPDRVAFITGGASGAGAACARAFVAAGACVVIADADAGHAAALAETLGARALGVQADVLDSEALAAAIARTVETFGGLHININCVGIEVALRTIAGAGAHPLDVFEEVVRINLVGTFNAVRLCARHMAASPPDAHGERGVIINATADAAFDGQAGQVAYAASKGGVAAMTRPLARDLEREGIRAYALAMPGVSIQETGGRSRTEAFAQRALALAAPGDATPSGEVIRLA